MAKKKQARADSIMQTVEECYVCRRTTGLEPHHCTHGTANRAVADRLGLWVWLCPTCHRGTKGVHGRDGHDLDLYLKQRAEQAYLETHTLDEWMEEIGKNFL